jgi:hypothetical protein
MLGFSPEGNYQIQAVVFRRQYRNAIVPDQSLIYPLLHHD